MEIINNYCGYCSNVICPNPNSKSTCVSEVYVSKETTEPSC